MQDRRLPTRVSNACDRCRRQKQRCDNFRPCTNCVKANRGCDHAEVQSPSSNAVHRRKRTRTAASGTLSPQGDLTPGPRQQAQSRSRSSERRHDVSHSPSHSRTMASPRTGSEEMRRREHSIVAEFGDSSSAMDITRRVLRRKATDQGGTAERATFAIPGGDVSSPSGAPETYRSIRDLIDIDLPPKATCDALIDAYFFTIHWFSLVVHEPTFRKRYHAISTNGVARASDRPFLLLLLMMVALSCQYAHSFIAPEACQGLDLTITRIEYLKVVRQNFMDLLDEDSLEFVQICTLLGSYWLYWGKPRSSFSILGACVKSAQAIYLHRQSSRRPLQHNAHLIEERKRVWWTIYTWDRFATIVYGRPLGISDKDCDVQMPTVFKERVVDVETSLTADIELSLYQTQLNQIYQIASPLLENIYGIRSSGDKSLLEMAETARKIDKSMQAWNHNLPDRMDLNSYRDLDEQSSLETKMHQLQSLSLQLTYQNLMIIIHRPLLADWSQRRGRESRAQSVHDNPYIQQPPSNEVASEVYERSFERCLQAALAVSRLQQSRPNLIRLAGKTHLVSFLGMNLFTSSVVLFICALSDVLSDAAQEAKRGIARNLRVLKSLSNAGSLSSQCSMIIEDLVQMIMDKERRQMLLGPTAIEGSSVASGFMGSGRQLPEASQRDENSRHLVSTTAYSQHLEPVHSESLAPANGTNTSLERTMESLHKVLNNATNPRVQQPRTDVPPPQAMDVNQHSTDQQMWTAGWPDANEYNTRLFSADDLQAQDMGQFWLWEMGSYSEDLSGWSIPEYHM